MADGTGSPRMRASRNAIVSGTKDEQIQIARPGGCRLQLFKPPLHLACDGRRLRSWFRPLHSAPLHAVLQDNEMCFIAAIEHTHTHRLQRVGVVGLQIAARCGLPWIDFTSHKERRSEQIHHHHHHHHHTIHRQTSDQTVLHHRTSISRSTLPVC